MGQPRPPKYGFIVLSIIGPDFTGAWHKLHTEEGGILSRVEASGATHIAFERMQKEGGTVAGFLTTCLWPDKKGHDAFVRDFLPGIRVLARDRIAAEANLVIHRIEGFHEKLYTTKIHTG